MSIKLLSIQTVVERTTLSRQEIYRRIKTGEFPKQIQLGPQRVAWLESAVDAWIEEMAAQNENKLTVVNP